MKDYGILMNNLTTVFNAYNQRNLNDTFANTTDSTTPTLTNSYNANYEFDKWIAITAITCIALIILGTVTLMAYIECSDRKRKRLHVAHLNQVTRLPIVRILPDNFARSASASNNSGAEDIEMS
jgi:hypothetical protein